MVYLQVSKGKTGKRRGERGKQSEEVVVLFLWSLGDLVSALRRRSERRMITRRGLYFEVGKATRSSKLGANQRTQID